MKLKINFKQTRATSAGDINSPNLLVYARTLEGRRGITDEFATIPSHLVLFLATLIRLAKSTPVHSLILSSHLFFCLPLHLFPFTVPCRIVFAKPEDLETWPTHLSYCFLTMVRSSSYSPMVIWIFLQTFSIDNMVLVQNVQYPPVASHLKGLHSFL